MPLSARSSSPTGLTAIVSTVLLLAVSLGTASASALDAGSKPAAASPAPDRTATASTRDAGRVDDPLEAIVPTPPPPPETAESPQDYRPGDSIQLRRYAIMEDRQYVRETIYTRLAAGWGLTSNTIQPSGED